MVPAGRGDGRDSGGETGVRKFQVFYGLGVQSSLLLPLAVREAVYAAGDSCTFCDFEADSGVY
jgi:hypothetical protein